MRNCNWLQALEGDIDTAHLAIMHLGGVSPDDLVPGTFGYYAAKDWRPRYKVVNTDFGTSYGAYRPAEEDSYYWRLAHFLFPFFTMIPTGVLGQQVLVRAWVPLDDEHTMFWSMAAQGITATELMPSRNGRAFAGTQAAPKFLPNTTGWLGRWRIEAEESNDYFIDREVQRNGSFTGIDGIHLQDQAITEGMGSKVDHSNEHLGVSDSMIIETRRRMMKAAIDLREGVVPPAVDRPELYRTRSGGVVLPREADWLEATRELRRAFVHHPELARSPNVLGPGD